MQERKRDRAFGGVRDKEGNAIFFLALFSFSFFPCFTNDQKKGEKQGEGLRREESWIQDKQRNAHRESGASKVNAKDICSVLSRVGVGWGSGGSSVYGKRILGEKVSHN